MDDNQDWFKRRRRVSTVPPHLQRMRPPVRPPEPHGDGVSLLPKKGPEPEKLLTMDDLKAQLAELQAKMDALRTPAVQHAPALAKKARGYLASHLATSRDWRGSDWNNKTRCGAWARSTGKPCQAQAMSNGRCRNHGGMSTGPKTKAGKARSLANLRRGTRARGAGCISEN